MPIVNGKIVRDKKPKKDKKVSSDTPKKEKKKNIIREGFDKFKKEMNVEKPKKDKKKSKKEDFIRTGTNSAIKIESSEFNGEDVIAIRKMYCTKADPEMKIGKGGFNLPADPKVLKSVIGALQDLLDEM
ncbi:hypothetical protein HOU08_gp117 [Dickeya phage vB_DsoM_JA29]|uniref:Uncharacterized protein n=1 Tax=Dickeya phage vB_DsoM_JA29 TaxID=2283031 RepID=A0A384ZX49_9CAUD|nr:hypothetical protein HOU08_gp117 [Dickeya phage vB_DsoM_JA29]AXG66843.1 hypothetical protein JA29_117 [Dickeya phage vB_DsoM_JA29]